MKPPFGAAFLLGLTMPMRLTRTGFPETQAGFKALRELIADKATRAAVRAGSEVISAEEIQEAPVLDHKTAQSTSLEPMAIKSGIRINSVRKVSDYVIRALVGPRKGTRKAAHLVEFGHRLIKGGRSWVDATGPKGPGRLIGDVPAHPFLRPAYESSVKKSIEAFAAELKKQLGRFIK